MSKVGGTYYEKNSVEDSKLFRTNPTWASFVNAMKEQYYPVGNFDDQYMRWTAL